MPKLCLLKKSDYQNIFISVYKYMFSTQIMDQAYILIIISNIGILKY